MIITSQNVQSYVMAVVELYGRRMSVRLSCGLSCGTLATYTRAPRDWSRESSKGTARTPPNM